MFNDEVGSILCIAEDFKVNFHNFIYKTMQHFHYKILISGINFF